MIPASALVRDYLCKQCEAPLKFKRDAERNLTAVCTKDEAHEGHIKKTTVEHRQAEDAVRAFEMRRNPDLCQIPGWPQPKPPSVAQCYEDLFG